MIKTIEWINNCSRMIDQTKIPHSFEYKNVTSSEDIYRAIKTMIVRGAPAIGIAGAHGVVLAAIEESQKDLSLSEFKNNVSAKAQYIKSSRPTAVNLQWGVDKQLELLQKGTSIEEIKELLIKNAILLEDEDISINKKIGYYGAKVVKKGATILTHCNAGGLATVGYGTALGVVRAAFENDNTIKVFADETRPRQQGARLTTFELVRDNIPTTLITDGMSAYFMAKGMIDMVVVGADRIAANGDTANKIGTYMVAIVAKYHGVPFYIAAPTSTIDISISSGREIPIEERSKEEVTTINGEKICADGVNIINPGFDVTPASLITGIITEKGILYPKYEESLKKIFN